jgi:hypothetical protein
MMPGGAWRFLAAALVAFPIAALLIYLSHEKGWNSPYRFFTIPELTSNGYVALAICVLPGVVIIATLPFRVHLRILLASIYIPIVAAAVFAFSIVFVGAVFHEYL